MRAAFHKPQREHHRASQLNAATEQWTERLVLTPAGKPGSHALFISLLDGFRPTGGLARAEEILMQSRFSSGTNGSLLNGSVGPIRDWMQTRPPQLSAFGQVLCSRRHMLTG